jgi:DNA-binding CsgD family transcriptional regulator
MDGMVAISGKELYNLTAGLYESAAETNVSGWQAIYERLSKLVDSASGMIHFRHKKDDFFDPIADTNVTGFIERFNSVYWHLLPYKQQFLGLKPGGRFLRTQDCPDDQYLGSELYRDHFEKLGKYEILHHRLFDEDRFAAGITFTRPRSKGRFNRSEEEFINALLPHVQRASRLHLQLLENNLTKRIMIEAWNHIDDGVVLVSNKGAVAFHNRAAKSILASATSIHVNRNGTLVCGSASESAKLQSVIKNVFDTSERKSEFGGRLLINRPNGKQPLNISITPFKEQDRYARESEKFALIFISDPDRTVATTEDSLRANYGLTKAEARVAKLLADGQSLREISDLLEITPNTVRTHLKRIFSKTETNRQSSLVKLILSGSTSKITDKLATIISAASLIWVMT